MTEKEPVNISTFFSEKQISCKTKEISRDKIIKDLLNMIADSTPIDVDLAFKEILEREYSFNTVMAKGFAMPHARLENLDNLVIAVATSEKGINFTSELDKSVNLIVLILAPKGNPALYLDVLSSLSRMFKDSRSIAQILKMNSAKDIYTFFKKGGLSVSGIVHAEDIMIPSPLALKETDSLKKAIDCFVKNNLTEIPVIDKDKELVGVVTVYELLKVCLPDYILWMDDLSPIVNFEPFSNILSNESSTWLAEIMSHDYAKVEYDAPAMMVAKDITKRGTQSAYVVKDKKLIGKISLIHFLDTVLRE